VEIIPQIIARFINDDIIKIFPMIVDNPVIISTAKTPEIIDFVKVFGEIPITFVAYQGTKNPLLKVITIAPAIATP
jgi:hypothetical protein